MTVSSPVPGRRTAVARAPIVVGGALAAKPYFGGHTWVFLNYLLGFQRLGWPVMFIDLLDEASCVGANGGPAQLEDSVSASYIAAVMRDFGLDDCYAVLRRGADASIGIPRARVMQTLRDSAVFLNVMGYIDDEEVLANARLRAFLDIDPGVPQMWHALGLHDAFTGYDRYVTVGENVGRADCEIPTCGLEWVTTRPPIVLERWPVAAGGRRFTSVVTWRGAFDPIEYAGRRYGQRVHEFRRFVQLPRLTGVPCELALAIHPDEPEDLARLEAGGWMLANPREVAGTPRAYQRYIRGSQAEIMVAKNLYVDTRSGWFSDRSACYLASGKPVLAQDTGVARLYPTDEGLITFSTLEEAVSGVEAISGDYDRHARKARELAEAYFDSGVILNRLLNCLGVQ